MRRVITNPDSEVTDHQYLTDGRLKQLVLSNACTIRFFYQDTDASDAYMDGRVA
jgi:hypothetical protein